LDEGGSLDPMNEASTSPAPRVTRRYPDRLIINVTNQCAMFCRHCQRRRNISEIDRHAQTGDLSEAIAYVADNREIRDVLITGGDALLLNDHFLDRILGALDRIPHVEIKRIGTRVPVTLPQRVTPELCDVLRRYPPIYINTQFNHPLEITPEARDACSRLIEAGAVLGNQAVLLKGINDSPAVMKKLNHELLRIRVRPYYIFHAKDVRGTRHWQTSIQTGLNIMESMRGHTSGLAVPTYIVNAPGGFGKIPVMPSYIVDMQEDRVTLRTWEGRVTEVFHEQ
jgi:lysine 2,3-aminomutase